MVAGGFSTVGDAASLERSCNLLTFAPFYEAMYAYLKGKLALKNPTYVIIDVGGVGYEVQISLYTYARIESLDEVRLWTQLIVREDSQTLFGFSEEAERALFNHLISVSGIGPNTARLILSGMTHGDVRTAILAEDDISFKKVKGVGPKTAKRLIVELKDKLIKTSADPVGAIPASQGNSSQHEALSALITLGYQKSHAQRAIAKATASIGQNPNTEDWIKAALKEL
jgi:Holliday junction DNA helicase RuvA